MIKGFKGTDKDGQCRGFQYESGKEYETEKVSCCNSGFHFCEEPFDVFGYYPPSDSKFFEVEGDGKTDKDNEDSKISCSKIAIGAEIGLSGIINAGVSITVKRAKENTKVESNTGYQSAATNTGNYSAATNTGNQSAATNTGDRSAATNTGYHGAASVEGKDSVAIATGYESKAKGALGCAIVVVERDEWNGETYPLIAIKSAIVDGETIKADTFYTVINGEFVEAK
ncbi:MAG: hypothetical protein VB081_10005 [Christensenella sp.]|uniref:DUF7666 domain-containing protein n=1 Tax=Christensenella sp. TaxID=1935934 RepID=UPI002B1FA5C6|nr:hypothetical protein [Christensenella sp.]MEA5003819.1 hypothetical protein [Christensenella sp.]